MKRVYIEIDIPKNLYYPQEENAKYDRDMELYYTDCENMDIKRKKYCKDWVKNNMPKYTFLKLENIYSECDGIAFTAKLI